MIHEPSMPLKLQHAARGLQGGLRLCRLGDATRLADNWH
jgi:hypothetical protein